MGPKLYAYIESKVYSYYCKFHFNGPDAVIVVILFRVVNP